MPIHNKLVRDRIPEIIERTGKNFSTRILNNEEYIKELKTKSREELAEYLEAENDKDTLEERPDFVIIGQHFGIGSQGLYQKYPFSN